MPGTSLGGTSRLTAALHKKANGQIETEHLSFSDCKSLLAQIDVSVRPGTSTEEARSLVNHYAHDLVARSLV